MHDKHILTSVCLCSFWTGTFTEQCEHHSFDSASLAKLLLGIHEHIGDRSPHDSGRQERIHAAGET